MKVDKVQRVKGMISEMLRKRPVIGPLIGIIAATAAVALLAQFLVPPESPVVEAVTMTVPALEPGSPAAPETPAAPQSPVAPPPPSTASPDTAQRDAASPDGASPAPAANSGVDAAQAKAAAKAKEQSADAPANAGAKEKAPVTDAKAGTAKTKADATATRAPAVAKTKSGEIKAPATSAKGKPTNTVTAAKGAKEAATAATKTKLQGPDAAQTTARPAAAIAPTPTDAVAVTMGARKAEYWSFWGPSQESSATSIDHTDWDRILRAYVVTNHPTGINRFRYGSVSKADQKKLKAYIERMAAMDPRTISRQEQKAYWLNLYNALTVNLVIEHYPVKSIRNIADKSLPDGPWDSKLVTIADQKVSLNDIEHRILRPIWQDNKIHFGLVGANLGCPHILPKAFTAKNSEGLLKQSRRDFVNDNRGVKLANGKLEVSQLFSWYQQDFAKTDKNLIKFFAFNAEDRKALYLLGFTGKIDYKTYDWALNAP